MWRPLFCLFIYKRKNKAKLEKRHKYENPKNTLFFLTKAWKAKGTLIAIKDTSPAAPKSISTSKVKNDCNRNWVRNWNPNGPQLPHHSAVQLLGFIKAILISFPGTEGILSPVDTGYGSGDGKVTSSADQCRLKNMVQQQDNGKKIIKIEWKHFNIWVS